MCKRWMTQGLVIDYMGNEEKGVIKESSNHPSIRLQQVVELIKS